MQIIRLFSQRPILTAIALASYVLTVTICLWAVFSIALVLLL